MKKEYLYQFESQIAGIPCLIGVSWYDGQRGSFSYNAASDLDYHGWFEAEWHILDCEGNLAPWLAEKMTRADDDRVAGEVQNVIEKEAAK